MAISLQSTPVVGVDTTNDATQTVGSVVVAAGSDTILVVTIAAEGDSAGASSTSGVTYNGDALTKLIDVDPGNWSRAEIWYRKAPDVTTANVVASYTGGPFGTNRAVIACYVLDGVDQTTTFRTPGSKSGASGTSDSITIASVVSSDYLIDCVSIDGTGHSPVQGADQTEYADGNTTGNNGASSAQLGSAGGVMSYSWTTAAPYSYVACALIAAAAAGGSMFQIKQEMNGIGAGGAFFNNPLT